MTTLTEAPQREGRLILLGSAFSLCARLLDEDDSGDPSQTAGLLRDLLERLGDDEALAGLGRFLSEAGDLRSRAYLRPLARLDVPPYETSYETSGPGAGLPQQLADIAGFYLAFGFRAARERPDHLETEGEFLSLLYVKEAYARISDDPANAEVCSEGRAKFLGEHLLPSLSSAADRASTGGHDALRSLVSLPLHLAAAH